MEHSSLTYKPPRGDTPKRKAVPCAKKTDSIHEQLKRLREQIQPLDLSPITDRLDSLEVELKAFTSTMRTQNEELTKKQIEVLELFGLALRKVK